MGELTGKKRIQFFMNLLSNNLDAAILAYKDNPSKPFGFYVHHYDKFLTSTYLKPKNVTQSLHPT